MQSGREQFLPFFSCRAWERVVVALCFDKETNVKKENNSTWHIRKSRRLSESKNHLE
ncbi:unnamed protein product [Larinioides sclopetarius]|uniref:Uncharacterized protein n=1 Tax=Larinioides sclopetarius TaxID=280406 RepID=A0AAV1Z7U6_9ARAC